MNTSRDDAAWERYERLNSAMAEEVFAEGAAGRPVYLDLEPDVLARITKHLGDARVGEPDELLIEVVKATLSDPAGPAGLFSLHTGRIFLWELEGSSSPPPCIGLLAALSLVAERMKQTEEFAGSNYYGRLLQTLDIDGEFHDRVGRDFRRQTPLLWNTLNRWLEESERPSRPAHRGRVRPSPVHRPAAFASARPCSGPHQVAGTVRAVRSAAGAADLGPGHARAARGVDAALPGHPIAQATVVKAVQQGTDLGGRVRRAGRLGRGAAPRAETRRAQAGRQSLPGCGTPGLIPVRP